MCLIIHKPAECNITADIVKSALDYNPDGFGIMALGDARKYKTVTQSQVMQILAEFDGIECAVHFRMATDGMVHKKLAHPFKLKNRAYLMHNGILSKYRTDRKAKESDTTRFVSEFCNPLISKHGSIPKATLEAEIIGSKVCIMQPNGVITRYGGEWQKHSGMYFSNNYAWDSPYYMSEWKSAKSVITGDFDDAELSELYFDRDPAPLADDITCRLLAVADMLPVNTPDYIYYDDLNLWDDLQAGLLHIDDFLCCCSTDTLLELYTVAVAQNLIAA